MIWMFVAFVIVWLAFFLYLSNIDRKQKAISREIADLSRRVGDVGPR